MNTNELSNLLNEVFENGWKFQADNHHPSIKKAGYYSNKTPGWFTKEGHSKKARPAGDSRPMWIAAKNIKEFWM